MDGREDRGGNFRMGYLPIFPSGEDANPMNRRLPAEVVSRRPRKEPKKVDEKQNEEVQVDLKTALSLNGDSRFKWLGKACKMVEDRNASSTDLYDIISSRKFAAGLNSKIGRKMKAVVDENLGLFSDKQKRYLRSDEWVLNAKYSDDKRPRDEDGGKDDDEKDKDDDDERIEKKDEKRTDMMSRVKEFVRDKTGAAIERRDVEEKGGWTTLPEDQDMRARQAAREAAEKHRDRKERERKAVEEAEDSRRKELEMQEARKRQLEDEVDDSLALLERLEKKKQQPPPSPTRAREESSGVRKKGLSRSRSISAKPRRRKRSASSSRSRGKDRGKKRRSGNLDELLRKRMEEREREVDSARIPVVDPGHARRCLR